MKYFLTLSLSLFYILNPFAQVADRLYKPNNTTIDTLSPSLVTVTVNPTTAQQPSMYSVNKNLLKWNTSQIRGFKDSILHIGSGQGYLVNEVDPVFSTSPAFGINTPLISNWNTAYSWGNHSGLYPLLLGSYSNPSWINSIAWNKITGAPSFLTSETDPIYSASTWFSTTNNSSNWNTAYSNRISSLTTVGNSGPASLTSNILNIPNYTLSGLGGQPQLNGMGFVKINGTTISYDNSTYLTTTSASGTYQPIGSYELLSNKAVNFSTANNTLYPTTQAVVNYVSGLGYLNASSGVVSSRILTINGLSQDLSSDRSWIVGDILSSGSYPNPTWITSLSWNKITGAPGFITTESDPIYSSSSWFSTINNSSNWNISFGWGNHATQGYLKGVDTLSLSSRINLRVRYSDTTAMLSSYFKTSNFNSFFDGRFSTKTTTDLNEGTNLYFTNSRSRNSISLTTTGTSGIATYNSSTGVLNIPNYTSSSGTVTSIGITGSDFSISNSPVTTSGNIGLSLANSGVVAGTYNGSYTVNAKGIITSANNVTINSNVSRSLSNATGTTNQYTISTTRNARVYYSINVVWSITALLSTSSTILLEYSTDGGTNWIIANQVSKNVNLGLLQSGSDDLNVCGSIPANALVRIRPIIATNATITYVRGQEELY